MNNDKQNDKQNSKEINLTYAGDIIIDFLQQELKVSLSSSEKEYIREEANCNWYMLGKLTILENKFRAYAYRVEKDLLMRQTIED